MTRNTDPTTARSTFGRLLDRLFALAAAQRIPLAGYEAPVGTYAERQRSEYGLETASQAALTLSAGTVTFLKAPTSSAPSVADETALAA